MTDEPTVSLPPSEPSGQGGEGPPSLSKDALRALSEELTRTAKARGATAAVVALASWDTSLQQQYSYWISYSGPLLVIDGLGRRITVVADEAWGTRNPATPPAPQFPATTLADPQRELAAALQAAAQELAGSDPRELAKSLVELARELAPTLTSPSPEPAPSSVPPKDPS